MAKKRGDCAVEFAATPAYEAAWKFVYGGEPLPGLESVVGLAKQLREEQAYRLARDLSALTRLRWKEAAETPTDKARLRQLLRVEVTCIYKDLELPADESLPLALQALADGGFPPETTTDPEMLGLAGAIHKRWWEYNGQRGHLERSLRFYQSAYGKDVMVDDGYQAINAAFILDLLASLETGDRSAARQTWREEAKRIRRDLVEKLSPVPGQERNWWFQAVLIEAHFGLDHDNEAVARLREAIHLEPPAWELESTLRQLVALARLRQKAGEELHATSGPWEAIQETLGETWAAGLRSSFIGKVGLALSGGGFRASLYHIGVLARLAELDLLRHVEVLSCVSGGSIIGAYYYLEVRNLLRNNPDSKIDRHDYILLVKRIEEAFLEGVRTNLRTRLLSEGSTILRNAWSASFSQTARLGELFEEELFSKVADGEAAVARWLNRLFIEPTSGPDDKPLGRPFNPRLDNWRRSAKVPILILNATTLNTGHSWQFTASNMGEAPSGSGGIETNPLLNRFRYQDGPDSYHCFRLGHAVAASAAVPGLFDPIVAEDLFKGYRLRLADGGVFDNQGIAGLLSQGCTLLLVSDASGQLPAQEDPGGGRLEVPLRSNNILMARGREVQHRMLVGRRDASLLRGLVYVHLTQDLDTDPLEADKVPGLPEELRAPSKQGFCTNYGIRRDIQAALARLRTDLDAFSNFEAWSLMESGYKAITKQIEECLREVPMSAELTVSWRFHAVASLITEQDRPEKDYAALCALLEAGESVFFKILRLRPRLLVFVKATGLVVSLAVMFAVAILTISYQGARDILGGLAALLIVALSLFSAFLLFRAFREKPLAAKPKTIVQRIGALVAGLATFLVAKAYLKWGNRLYLEDGVVPAEGLPPGARRLCKMSPES